MNSVFQEVIETGGSVVIGVLNLKGGPGKSMVSRNIAVYYSLLGFKVAILDTDTNQLTSCEWNARRREEWGDKVCAIEVVPLASVEELVSAVEKLQKSNYHLIIIDGAPHLDTLATSAILVSDIVLIPVAPSVDDLASYRRFLRRYKDAKAVLRGLRKIHAFNVISRYTDRHQEDSEIIPALRALEEEGIVLLSSIIKERVAYKRSAKYGLGVLELDDREAKNEIAGLCLELESRLSNN